MPNYTNDGNKPFKKGKITDIVKLKRRLFTRLRGKTSEKEVIALKVDLIRVLTDIGLVLQNTHTIARGLVKLGWVKTKNIEKDDH